MAAKATLEGRPGCRGALLTVGTSYRRILELRYLEPDRSVLVCQECGQLSLWRWPLPGEDAILLGCDDPVLAKPGSVDFPLDVAKQFLATATEKLCPTEGKLIAADDEEDPFAE